MTTLPHTDIAPEKLQQLRGQVSGIVAAAGDADYDRLRAGFNVALQQQPAVIVEAQSAQDVAAAVNFANADNRPLSVKATGHGTIIPANGSVMIVTAALKQLEVNADEQTAVIGAGLLWGDVLQEAQKSGLAPLLGSSPTVGVVGYTLGGGLGWLARKYGLALDSVIYFDIVTPDGKLVRASADENSDLFWALRGGGGNFGVVTAMKIRLYPVSRVYGGNLFYPVDQASDVIARYRDWAANAPDELTSSVLIMNFPPLPMVPEPLRGKSFVIVRGCYVGSMEDGEQLLSYWREWRTPAMDMFGEMPFTQVAAISQDPTDPMPADVSGVWLNEINDDVVNAMVSNFPPQGGPPAILIAEIRHIGGKVASVASNANAFSNRSAPFLLETVALVPSPDAAAAVSQTIANLHGDMQSALTGSTYLNFNDGEKGRQRSQDHYNAENYAQLKQIKQKYDPQDRFRFGVKLTD